MPRSTPDRLRWIAAHWRPYRRELAGIVVLTFLNAGVAVSYPVFLLRIVDGISAGLSTSFIVQNVLWILGVGVLQAVVYLSLQYLRMKTNLGLDFGIRMRAFEHFLRMGPGFFARFRTGDLVTRLTDDVSDKLAWYLCSGIFRTLEAATIILFGAVMMLRISPELTLYAAGPLPILVGIYVLMAQRLETRSQAVQRSISEVNDVLESSFSGIRVIKGFATEELHIDLSDRAFLAQRRAEIRAVRYQTVIDSLYGQIWQLAVVAVLLAGGTMVMRGTLTLGELVAMDAYVLLLVFPMFDVGQFLVRGRVSAVSIGRLRELEDVPPEVPDRSQGPLPVRTPESTLVADPAPGADGPGPLAVRLEEASYTYAGATRPALNRVSFAALPGTMTAVVGEIASGKSTALRLVPRIMDPSAGRVVVGEKPAVEWDAETLRHRIGYVPQDPVLFSATVRENIRFGRGWVSDADLDMAVETAGLRLDLAGWTHGLDTAVGAHGVGLSGGQKQRVALARALAGRPSVLLLDDCTSALDAETEDRVWAAVFRELPECAALVVTHRPATLERARWIAVLEAGAVVEAGTFRDLERPGTRFHDLYARWKLEGVTTDGVGSSGAT